MTPDMSASSIVADLGAEKGMVPNGVISPEGAAINNLVTDLTRLLAKLRSARTNVTDPFNLLPNVINECETLMNRLVIVHDDSQSIETVANNDPTSGHNARAESS